MHNWTGPTYSPPCVDFGHIIHMDYSVSYIASIVATMEAMVMAIIGHW